LWAADEGRLITPSVGAMAFALPFGAKETKMLFSIEWLKIPARDDQPDLIFGPLES
jgi:hypothetical protein